MSKKDVTEISRAFSHLLILHLSDSIRKCRDQGQDRLALLRTIVLIMIGVTVVQRKAQDLHEKIGARIGRAAEDHAVALLPETKMNMGGGDAGMTSKYFLKVNRHHHD